MSQGQGTSEPRKFPDAKKLYQRGMVYITKSKETNAHITLSGLCIYLTTTKETLNTYGSGKFDHRGQNFSMVVKKLRLQCENYAETRLYGNNPTGAIFALKNYGWKDKQETISTTVNLNKDVTALTDAELALELKKYE